MYLTKYTGVFYKPSKSLPSTFWKKKKKKFGERDLGLFGFYFSNKDITKATMIKYYHYFINKILMPKWRAITELKSHGNIFVFSFFHGLSRS